MADSSYSPRLRTAVLLCGAGTAGAYQAGVLRALSEAGVKVDLLAAHGAGVPNALAAAIDGGNRFWAPNGPWTSPRLTTAYRWRSALRWGAIGIIGAGLALVSPLLVLVFAALVYALSLLLALVNLPDAAAALVGFYDRSIAILFHPPILPTILPRLVVLAVLVVFGVLVGAAVSAFRHDRTRRRQRGAMWWRLIGSPLDPREPASTLVEALWNLVRGASPQAGAASADLGRRYVEILSDNFGQPGFRETMIAVHDMDGRRDLVGAILPDGIREGFLMRRHGGIAREAEIVDFRAQPQRELLVDFVLGAVAQPVASAPHAMQFPAEAYWRGELHRLCDRPELAARLIDEIANVGIEQVILVSAAAPSAVPHAMRTQRVDLRGRMGETLRSIETAALDDAWANASSRFSGVFVVRPDHNPLGPFDFDGAYDEASDRQRTTAELIQQGYDDAYRRFIEPTVASGERVESI